MSDRMTETELTEYLDEFGVLDTARSPGVYALELAEPPNREYEVLRSWVDTFDAAAPEGLPTRLAAASTLLYVGSHGQSMYSRMAEHCRGHKTSTIMAVWPPVSVEGIWPGEDPALRERQRARELSGEFTAVWTDGELV